jgi:hypothetical protein
VAFKRGVNAGPRLLILEALVFMASRASGMPSRISAYTSMTSSVNLVIWLKKPKVTKPFDRWRNRRRRVTAEFLVRTARAIEHAVGRDVDQLHAGRGAAAGQLVRKFRV